MRLQKLFYSKCPHCGKHGLPAWKTEIGRVYNYTLTCKYCNKKYIANAGLTTIAVFAVIIGLYYVRTELVDRIIHSIPTSLSNFIWYGCFAVGVFALYLVNYFFPVKEIEE